MSDSTAAAFERLYRAGTGYQVSKIVFTAARLGIFAALDRGPATIKKLAGSFGLSPDALERFMAALQSLGLAAERKGMYRRAGGGRFEEVLVHLETLKTSWAHLDYSLKKGVMQQPGKKTLADYPRRLKKFLTAMHVSGAVKSDFIMKELPLQRFRRMLDIGGGMGTYATAFARKNPNLQAAVFDLADVAAHAKKYIRQSGLSSRVSAVAGQCLTDPLPGRDYDLVLLSNILHIYTGKDSRAIIKKAAGALQRGGTLLIHDYITGLGDPVFVSLFDLTMLTGTPQGRCHSRDDLFEWLKAAGISRIRAKAVNAGTAMVWGTKEQ